jgi:hypothetical protein
MLRCIAMILNGLIYPMKRKSEAHETLFLLLKCDSAPTHLVSDGAKEEPQFKFHSRPGKRISTVKKPNGTLHDICNMQLSERKH